MDYLDTCKSDNQKIEKDEASIFAEGWACVYRKLTDEQRLYAKKIIDETLLLAQLNKLRINSTVTPSSSSSGTPYYLTRASTPLFLSNDGIIRNASEVPTNANVEYQSFNDLLQDHQYS